LKLQSQVSRRVEKKEYRKFWIVIPNEVVERLGWESGEELEPEVKGQTLIIRNVSRKVLMAKHGLDKGSIFKPLTQLRNIGSAMSGKMYVCKCGMIFDSADKFNEHMKEVQRKQLVLPG